MLKKKETEQASEQFRMHQLVVTLLVVLVGGIATADDENTHALFSFGGSAGDTALSTEDDGFSDAIDISTSEFVFFGKTFSSIYVSCQFLSSLMTALPVYLVCVCVFGVYSCFYVDLDFLCLDLRWQRSPQF